MSEIERTGETLAKRTARGPVVGGAVAAVLLAAAGTAYHFYQQPAPAPAVSTAPAAPEAPADAQPKATEPAQQQAVATPPAQPAPAAADVKPSFDAVRVEPTGEAVISGRASPGAEVLALLNGAEVGRATANAEGSFVIIPATPLPKGTGNLTLSATVNGKAIASENSLVVAVRDGTPAMVAKVDETQPTTVVQPAEATANAAPGGLQLGAVDYDEQGNIVFSGKAGAGAVVRFYVDNQLAGEAKADDAGAWSFKGSSTVAEGTHMLRADVVGADGKVANRIELPFQREAAAKVAAASEAQAPQAAGEPAEEMGKIVIQPGNNLWKLSRKIYGKGRLFTVIYEANKDQVRDPSKIYPGQVLLAPKQAN